MAVDNTVVVRDGRIFESGTGVSKEIRVVKPNESAIIASRRASALKRIKEMENELGRLTRLLSELRADVQQLTTE